MSREMNIFNNKCDEITLNNLYNHEKQTNCLQKLYEKKFLDPPASDQKICDHSDDLDLDSFNNMNESSNGPMKWIGNRRKRRRILNVNIPETNLLNAQEGDQVSLSNNQDSIIGNKKMNPICYKYLLEEAFRMKPYLNKNEIESLSLNTNLSITQIASWFARKRFKMRKSIEIKSPIEKTQLRKYISFNNEVLIQLENAFETCNRVTGYEKNDLCYKLNLTPTQIEKWYYRRRKKQLNDQQFSNAFLEEYPE